MYIGEGNTLVAADGQTTTLQTSMATVSPSEGGDYPRGASVPCPPCPPPKIIEKIVEKKVMVPVPGPTVFIDRTVPGPVQTVYRDRDCPAQSSTPSAQTPNLLIPMDRPPQTSPSSGGDGFSGGDMLIDTSVVAPKKKFPWWLIAAAAATVYVMRDEIFG